MLGYTSSRSSVTGVHSTEGCRTPTCPSGPTEFAGIMYIRPHINSLPAASRLPFRRCGHRTGRETPSDEELHRAKPHVAVNPLITSKITHPQCLLWAVRRNGSAGPRSPMSCFMESRQSTGPVAWPCRWTVENCPNRNKIHLGGCDIHAIQRKKSKKDNNYLIKLSKHQ